jgi:hypothetical protein
MKTKYLLLLILLLTNFNEIYSIESDNEVNGMLSTAKEIAKYTKEGKLYKCLNLCYPNSMAYNNTLARIKYYELNKEELDSIKEDAKNTKFYFLEKIFKQNDEEGLIVLVINSDNYVTSVFWTFKKIKNKYFLNGYISLNNSYL